MQDLCRTTARFLPWTTATQLITPQLWKFLEHLKIIICMKHSLFLSQGTFHRKLRQTLTALCYLENFNRWASATLFYLLFLDKDNDGQLDPYELESLFYREVFYIVILFSLLQKFPISFKNTAFYPEKNSKNRNVLPCKIIDLKFCSARIWILVLCQSIKWWSHACKNVKTISYRSSYHG